VTHQKETNVEKFKIQDEDRYANNSAFTKEGGMENGRAISFSSLGGHGHIPREHGSNKADMHKTKNLMLLRNKSRMDFDENPLLKTYFKKDKYMSRINHLNTHASSGLFTSGTVPFLPSAHTGMIHGSQKLSMK